MRTGARVYGYLIAGVLFLFLLLSDWIILNGPLLAVRRGLLAALALAAVPYVLCHRRAVVRAVLASPLVFFAAFLAFGLAVAPFALAPASAAAHTLVFAWVMLFAVAAAQTVSPAATLALLRLALALKLVASLLLGLVGSKAGPLLASLADGTLGEQHIFGGLFGNPNPLGEAAAAYLLLAVCHVIEQRRRWPAGVRGWLQGAWYVVTTAVAAYLMWQSLSSSAWVALATSGVAIGGASLWRALGPSLSRRRCVVLTVASALLVGVATVSLLIWINASRGIGNPNAGLGERIEEPIAFGRIFDTRGRTVFWEFALARIRERAWTGYGMSSTPAVFTQLVGPAKEHAHNLELEAALYAGIPAALLIVLLAATSLAAAAQAFISRRPQSLSVAAILLLLYILAQVEPVVFGSPYPSLLIVLVLAAHLQRQQDAAAAAYAPGEQ